MRSLAEVFGQKIPTHVHMETARMGACSKRDILTGQGMHKICGLTLNIIWINYSN